MSAIDDYRKKFGTTTKAPSLIEQYRATFKPTTTTPSAIDLYRQSQGIVSTKADTKTSQGLYNLASQNGLKNQADSILKNQQGEKTKEIFSGGFISDIFDVLNAFQYGTVGLAQGKTFAQGVNERSSFTDTLKDKGVAGIVGGIVLDIAFDPLTYIAPTTVVRKIPFATKLLGGAKNLAFGKKVTKTIEGTENTYEAVEGGTRAGKYLASKVVYMQGADPIFRETFERSTKNIAVTTQSLADLGKSISKLEPSTAKKLLTRDETGRFVRTNLNDLKGKLKPKELEPIIRIYGKIDNLGKEAVDLGLLSQAKYEENIGQYIKNAYTEYEQVAGKGVFGTKPAGIKGIKNRVDDLSPEKMAELGQIDNPAYLLFKSAFDLTRDVENAKLLRAVSQKFGTDVAQEGFTKIGTGKKWGELAGKYVPDHMASYLNEVIEPAQSTLAKNLVANFKFFKVVMNPGTHARNIVSNKILNYWKLGMNPLDPRVVASDIEAVKEIAKGTGKWTEEARPLGYNLNTFASQEMKTLLDSPEAMLWGKTQKGWAATKQKLGDIYQGEENWAKLSAYIYNRKKGIVPEEAWKAAESATFNYAQVTPFVRKLRESLFGFPFITFTVKSTPVALETMVKNPGRISVIGKIKQGIENLADIKETDRERASEPAWVKDGFYIKLPIKDSKGRSAYFDLTYILPFGDLVAGNFFERGQNMQTGMPENYVTSSMKKSPFIQTVGNLYKNQNFYGNSIFKESDSSDKQLKDIMTYLTKSYVPPLVGDVLHNGYNARTGKKDFVGIREALSPEEEANQKRTLMQELLRNVGAKIQPMDADIQETYTEWNKKKALENLLRENGIINTMNINYVPENTQ